MMICGSSLGKFREKKKDKKEAKIWITSWKPVDQTRYVYMIIFEKSKILKDEMTKSKDPFNQCLVRLFERYLPDITNL